MEERLKQRKAFLARRSERQKDDAEAVEAPLLLGPSTMSDILLLDAPPQSDAAGAASSQLVAVEPQPCAGSQLVALEPQPEATAGDGARPDYDDADAAEAAAAAATRRPTDEAAAARGIFESYCDFFSHISFRKGWKIPPFKRADAEPAFRRAARVVALIRSRDLSGSGFTVRQRDGSARDWMHDAPSPVDSADAFFDGLLHATFQDANGYVEGLTAAEVDRLAGKYAEVHIRVIGSA